MSQELITETDKRTIINLKLQLIETFKQFVLHYEYGKHEKSQLFRQAIASLKQEFPKEKQFEGTMENCQLDEIQNQINCINNSGYDINTIMCNINTSLFIINNKDLLKQLFDVIHVPFHFEMNTHNLETLVRETMRIVEEQKEQEQKQAKPKKSKK